MKMFETRRKDRLLSDDECERILKFGSYGVLSTINENGYPYGVPLSYVYFNNFIYIHGSKEQSLKFDNIKFSDKVCFSVVNDLEILPEKFSRNYESVIIFGTIKEVFDEEKELSLLQIVKKYSPNFIEEGKKYINSAKNLIRVMKIEIVSMSAKGKR